MSVSALSSGIPSLFSVRPPDAASAPAPAHDSPHDGDADDVSAASPSQNSQAAKAAVDRGQALDIKA